MLRRTSPTGKERRFDTFIAGLLGGYAVFGRGIQSSVNQQISIYVFARVALALAKISVEKGIVPDFNGQTTSHAWPIFASLSWAFVMYLFRWHPETLQPSLKSSMKYMYVSTIPCFLTLFADIVPAIRYLNADHWDSFRNFLIHNQ